MTMTCEKKMDEFLLSSISDKKMNTPSSTVIVS
jgi:hypothetical protein